MAMQITGVALAVTALASLAAAVTPVETSASGCVITSAVMCVLGVCGRLSGSPHCRRCDPYRNGEPHGPSSEGEKVQRGTHDCAVGTSGLLQSGVLLTPSSLPSFRLCRSKVLSCRNKVLARIFIYASFYKCICVYASFCISMCTYLYTFFNVYAMMILCTDIYVFECIYVYMY